MPLYLISAPTDDVVSLADVKSQLRVTSTDDDLMIDALILAAVNQIDPAGGGWLGRALRPQTWEWRGSAFPAWYDGCGYSRNFHLTYAAELPYPPLIAIDSVKYDNGDGVETTLVAGTGYRVFGVGGLGKGRIEPVYNGSWPTSVRYDPESVRIRFTAGYENGSVADELPAPIKQAVIIMVKQLYEMSKRDATLSQITIEGVSSRSYVLSENTINVLKSVSENLLAPYRVWD
jgi:uncharacterized phiE125 gp8 family phage protein